jgi:hypothetical protein
MINGMEVIDAHCHVYPEKIVSRAVAGTDTFYGTVAACVGTVADLAEEHAEAGVDRAIIQSVATTPKQVASINRFIAESVAESGGRLIGLGTLHQDSEDQAADVKNAVELGLRGIKLHPDIQDFKVDDPRAERIYELCAEYGLPLLMHTGDKRYDNSNPDRLLPMIRKYREVTFIGAHFGGWSIWEDAWKELAGEPNLWVDCSSSFSWIGAETAGEIIKHFGADRVLFGTDFPMWKPKTELDTFMTIEMPDSDRRAILAENAKRVFKIK